MRNLSKAPFHYVPAHTLCIMQNRFDDSTFHYVPAHTLCIMQSLSATLRILACNCTCSHLYHALWLTLGSLDEVLTLLT